MIEEETKARAEKGAAESKIPKNEIIRFARTLLSLVKDNEKENWFKKRGVDFRTYQSNKLTFPRWQQAFLSLIYRDFINDNEFTEFNDDRKGTPTYEILEYKRGQSASLPIEGYSWTSINEKTIILEIDYGGCECWVKAHHNKEDQETVKKFLMDLKEKVNAIGYLQGEKLLVTKSNKIKFFDFKHTTKRDLVLPNKIWKSLNRNLFAFLKNKQLITENNLEWKRGILIWGPPGTGKTLLGKFLCTSLDTITILWVTPKCVGESSDIEKLFEMARILMPTIIFIEDLDFFAASRDRHGLHPVLGELLTQLDGISSNDGVFVVGTTNNQRILDRAIACRPSRFDVRLEFDVPEKNERKKIFALFLSESKEIDYNLLANKSEEFSAAHIKEACVRGILSTIFDKEKLQSAILYSIEELREEELNRPPPAGPIS